MPRDDVVQVYQSERPPAQPSYILRGHKAQVHALLFLRLNSRLLSGDAEGLVILWNTASKRATAVWKAHNGGILGFGVWHDSRILTHGRDGKLRVWQLGEAEEAGMSSDLPVHLDLNGGTPEWKKPWQAYTLDVHTLNFCAFASCLDEESGELLIATPAANEGWTLIQSLPSGVARYLVPAAEAGKTGMVMALKVIWSRSVLHVITAYESGLTGVQKLCSEADLKWETIVTHKAHSQPILSLDVIYSKNAYLTSGADAVIARCTMEPTNQEARLETLRTGHSGQQSLCVRNDEKIFATAGWDGRIRVYSSKHLKEVAVLKWHGEGCYATAFADILDLVSGDQQPGDRKITTLNNENDMGNQKPGIIREHTYTNDDQQPSPEHVQGAVHVNTTSDGSLKTSRIRRETKAQRTHWLAAGSKDGKISLWNVF